MSELDQLREALDGFDEIRLAIVFGSVGLGHATYFSDLDIAVLCEHTMSSDLRSALISILARATVHPIDLVDLTRAGEPLLGEILKNGTRILSRDDSAYAELLRKHLFDATDFLPYRNRIPRKGRVASPGLSCQNSSYRWCGKRRIICLSTCLGRFSHP